MRVARLSKILSCFLDQLVSSNESLMLGKPSNIVCSDENESMRDMKTFMKWEGNDQVGGFSANLRMKKKKVKKSWLDLLIWWGGGRCTLGLNIRW